MTSAAYRRNAPAAKEHFPFAAVFLCPARYSAMRGLLCPARHCALHGLLCRNVHICRGAPHYFYDRQNFLCRQGFSCAERSHRADFARAGARACPCNADMWILSSVRQPWVRQRRIRHKKPPRSDLTPLRRGSDGNYGVGFHADGCGLFIALRCLCRRLSRVFAYHAEERTYRRH